MPAVVRVLPCCLFCVFCSVESDLAFALLLGDRCAGYIIGRLPACLSISEPTLIWNGAISPVVQAIHTLRKNAWRLQAWPENCFAAPPLLKAIVLNKHGA